MKTMPRYYWLAKHPWAKQITMRTGATSRSHSGTISQETGWGEVVWQSACPIPDDSDEPAPVLVHGKLCWALGRKWEQRAPRSATSGTFVPLSPSFHQR